MPEGTARDPHTLVFDHDGNIWFTAQQSNYVGKLTVATGRSSSSPSRPPQARPYGIKIDSKNRPWFNEFGTNKIAHGGPGNDADPGIHPPQCADPGSTHPDHP